MTRPHEPVIRLTASQIGVIDVVREASAVIASAFYEEVL